MLTEESLPKSWPAEVVTLTADPTRSASPSNVFPRTTSSTSTLLTSPTLPEESNNLLTDSLLILLFGSLVTTTPI